MASMVEYGGSSTTADDQLARRFSLDSEGLTAFRVHAGLDYARSLSTLIESEIIPRLMVAHAGDFHAVALARDDQVIDYAEVEDFAPLAMQVEADALLAHVEAILARGVSVDTIMVDLLAPTARLLGEYWEEDRCDFVDVTMGLWRLQEVVHEIAARAPIERRLAAGGYRALFASMPGDQHNFGTVVIDEMFRCAGWITDRLHGPETADLVKRVGSDWFDLVGLTVSRECHKATLCSVIAALRNVSKNPQLCVMVGGRVFSEDPALAAKVGADGTARDAKIALQVAWDLVRHRAMETAHHG